MSYATMHESHQPPEPYQPASLLDLIASDVIRHLLAGFSERLKSGVAFYCHNTEGGLVRIDIDSHEGNARLHWSEICTYFRQDSKRDKRCRDCDEGVARTLLTQDSSEPIHYPCTVLGLTDLAAQVLVCGRPLAVVIMGQRLPRDESKGREIVRTIVTQYPAESDHFQEAYQRDLDRDAQDRSRSNLYDDLDLPSIKKRLGDFAATVEQIAANVAQLKIQTRQREFRDYWMRKLSHSQPENLTTWQHSLAQCLTSLREFLKFPVERIGLYAGTRAVGRIRYSLMAMDNAQWWPLREFDIAEGDLIRPEHYAPDGISPSVLGPYAAHLAPNKYYSLHPFRQKAAQAFGEIFSVVAIQTCDTMTLDTTGFDFCQDFLDALCRMDATVRLYLRQKAVYEEFEQHVTDIAHDLGTSSQHVVNNIELYTEFLNRGIPAKSSSAIERLELVQRSIHDHMARVGQLEVPYSTGRDTPLESINLYDAVREQISLFETTAEKRRVKVDAIDLCVGKAFVVCERSELMRAVAALLDNAIKYSYPDRIVHVKGHTELDLAYLHFSNYGDGVPPDMLDDIRKRHTRAHNPGRGRVRPGSGLGLPIAIFVFEKLLQGRIRIASSKRAYDPRGLNDYRRCVTNVFVQVPLGY